MNSDFISLPGSGRGGGRRQRGAGRGKGQRTSRNSRDGGDDGGGGGGGQRRRRGKGGRKTPNYGLPAAAHLARRPSVPDDDEEDSDELAAMLDYLANTRDSDDSDGNDDDNDSDDGEAIDAIMRTVTVDGGGPDVFLPTEEEIELEEMFHGLGWKPGSESESTESDTNGEDHGLDDDDDDDDDDGATDNDEEKESEGDDNNDKEELVTTLNDDGDDIGFVLDRVGDPGVQSAIMEGIFAMEEAYRDRVKKSRTGRATSKQSGKAKKKWDSSKFGKQKQQAASSTPKKMGGITFVKAAGLTPGPKEPAIVKDEMLIDDDESGNSDSAVDGNMSKSARRKSARAERKSRRTSNRENKKQLREEQSRIASALKGIRPGDTISPAIISHLDSINKRLHAFASIDGDDDTQDDLLPPMPSSLRHIVKEMCARYGITPKTRGSGTNKLVVLFRTNRTRVPEAWRSIVSDVVVSRSTGDRRVLKGNTKSCLTGRKDNVRRGPPGAPDDSVRPRVGDIVGQGASRLGEDNRGYGLLLALGWTPGMSLGVAAVKVHDANVTGGTEDPEGTSSAKASGSGGIVDPVAVTVRAKRRGLGAE